MQVIKIYPQGFAANCYLLTEDGRSAIAVDPSAPRVLKEAQKRGLEVKYVLLTHGHYDHIGGCAALQGAGAKIGCLEAERGLVFGAGNLAAAHGLVIPPFTLDFTMKDGEVLSLCGMTVRVIATPGHTAGGASYLVGDRLFTGDTLFEESIGRTDLPTGNGRDLTDSVRKLYALAGDFVVCAGHGEDTSLEHERHCNAYIRV